MLNSWRRPLQALQERLWRFEASRIPGVVCARSVRFWGRPQWRVLGGVIELQPEVVLRSDPTDYHAAMYGPVRLVADRPGARIVVGQGSRLNGCTIHAWRSVSIGRFCLIAANSSILDAHGHSTCDADWERRHLLQDEPEPVVLEDHVWVGLNCLICKGVRIGKGSVVAAGSVVTRDVPEFTLVGGVPARVIRPIIPETT